MALHGFEHQNMVPDGAAPDTGAVKTIFTTEDGITECRGITVPTDTATGYAPGCIFVHVDGTSGTSRYVNEGTKASCDFNAVTTGENLAVTVTSPQITSVLNTAGFTQDAMNSANGNGPRHYYVDSDNGLDTYDGLTWDTAKKTIQAGVNLCTEDNCTVYVGGSSYSEAVTTPGAGDPINRCKLIAVSGSRQFPLWQSGATGSSHLTIIGADWEVWGFRFHSSANTAPYIALAKDVGATEYVDGIVIANNWFSGATAKMAIQASGGVTACQIRNNRFNGFTTTATYEGAVCGTDYVQAAVFWEITDNFFANNTKSLNLMLNCSDVKRNSFTTATGEEAATLVLNTGGEYDGGGGGNVVSDNYFSDVAADIDNTAGYYGSANDVWAHNHCTDAEDSGVPAAT